jgi:hypothetical protein
MERISVPPNELKAAGMVAANASIESVRLNNAQIHCPDVFERKPDHPVEFQYRWNSIPPNTSTPGLLVVGIAIEVVLRPQSSEQPDEEGLANEDEIKQARIALEYELIYRLPSGEIPHEVVKLGGLEAFARWNSLYTCWPYFRQELDHIFGICLLPRIQLPLIKLVPGKDQGKKA